jgi:putative flippase GtrA
MGLAEWLGEFLSHDASPFAQFVKYALAGGLATGVHVLTFFLVGFFFLPCVNKDDVLVRLFRLNAPEVDERLRARYAVYSNVAAFMVSNTVAYVANRLFVFQPGRHSAVVEFALFFVVSAVSVGIGTTIMGELIKRLRMQTTYAFGANVVSSLAINFVMRKFVVFNG